MGGCASSPATEEEGGNHTAEKKPHGAARGGEAEQKFGFDAMGKTKTSKEVRLLLLGEK